MAYVHPPSDDSPTIIDTNQIVQIEAIHARTFIILILIRTHHKPGGLAFVWESLRLLLNYPGMSRGGYVRHTEPNWNTPSTSDE